MSDTIFYSSRSRKFFVPGVKGIAALRREIFYLAYHLHWPYESILAMESDERQSFIKLLSDEIQRQNQEIEDALKKNKF
jgi:hypothetical protein